MLPTVVGALPPSLYAAAILHMIHAHSFGFLVGCAERGEPLVMSAEVGQELLRVDLPAGRKSTLDGVLELVDRCLGDVWPDEPDRALAGAVSG